MAKSNHMIFLSVYSIESILKYWIDWVGRPYHDFSLLQGPLNIREKKCRNQDSNLGYLGHNEGS